VRHTHWGIIVRHKVMVASLKSPEFDITVGIGAMDGDEVVASGRLASDSHGPFSYSGLFLGSIYCAFLSLLAVHKMSCVFICLGTFEKE
jgi:hypothetical protein